VNEGILLVLAAAGFAFITGANDGATLLAINLSNPAVRPIPALLALALGVAVVPLVAGALVAETIAHGLVSFADQGGPGQFMAAVLVSLGVAYALSRWRLPTSLTLALLGAIVGTGLGLGLAVAWSTVAIVLLVASAALVASLLAGLLAVRAFGYLPVPRRAASRLRVLGGASFALQAIAYAANDGQKMLAVLAIAVGLGADGRISVEPAPLLVLAVLFALGTLFGVERFAGRLSRGVLPVRALHAGTSQLASGISVLGAATVGVPVSMTHAATAALVGAGVSDTVRRVRWQHALRIGAAWLLTLPASVVVGALVGSAWRLLA
jgi:inorganic phosphate transporter, PiT family